MKKQLLDNATHTPARVLSSMSDETKAATQIYSNQQSVHGSCGNYMGDHELASTRVEDFTKLRIDPSMVEYVNANDMSLPEYLEELDPSANYAVGTPLSMMSALDRQFMRFGFLKPNGRNVQGCNNSLPLAYSIAHTPANTVLFPAFMKQNIFWEPLKDVDLDPNVLFATTRAQNEETWKQIQINDSQWRNKRLFKLAEMAEVPVSRLTLSGYSGSMTKHGIGHWYSMEFARKVSMDLFQRAIQRSAMKERRSHFDHVIDVIQNGNTTYGMATGANVEYAEDYDAIGCTGDGEISFLALSLFLYGMRPYKPTLAVQNVNTFHNYIQATPPKNVTDVEVLRLMAASRYPGMPQPVNYDFMGQTPPALVVPNDVLADNVIIFIDVANSIERVVQTGMEINDLGYNMDNQTYKQIHTMKDGIGFLPAFLESCKILSLTVN